MFPARSQAVSSWLSMSFFSSFADAPSRNPPTLSSDGTTSHESETTSHPPHAPWHHAPNAATHGGATTNHTGNPLPCTRASENPVSLAVGGDENGRLDFRNRGGKEGASGQAHVGSSAG